MIVLYRVRSLVHIVCLEVGLRNAAKVAYRTVLKFEFVELALHLFFLLGGWGLMCHFIIYALWCWVYVWWRLNIGMTRHIDSTRAILKSFSEIFAFTCDSGLRVPLWKTCLRDRDHAQRSLGPGFVVLVGRARSFWYLVDTTPRELPFQVGSFSEICLQHRAYLRCLLHSVVII